MKNILFWVVLLTLCGCGRGVIWSMIWRWKMLWRRRGRQGGRLLCCCRDPIARHVRGWCNASALAESMSQFNDPSYLICYADIFQQAKYIANPNYSPDDEAKLVLPEEIILSDCVINEPREFDIEITNEGKYPLQISDVKHSCTCLELLSDKQLSLAPNEKSTVRVSFTAEAAGDFYREVMFFSNSAEKLMRVAVRATAVS